MRIKSRLAVALVLVLAAVALAALAEVIGNNALGVTGASQTVTFARAVSSVSFFAPGDNEPTVYMRLFTCGDAPADASGTSPIALRPGSTVNYNFDSRTESIGRTDDKGPGYCAFSVMASPIPSPEPSPSPANIATLEWQAK